MSSVCQKVVLSSSGQTPRKRGRGKIRPKESCRASLISDNPTFRERRSRRDLRQIQMERPSGGKQRRESYDSKQRDYCCCITRRVEIADPKQHLSQYPGRTGRGTNTASNQTIMGHAIWRSIAASTCIRSAPSASRIAISLVRCDTESARYQPLPAALPQPRSGSQP
jgi:hypothetical protein